VLLYLYVPTVVLPSRRICRLPLGVEGSPGGKWLRMVWGRQSPPSWHPLVAGGSASEQMRLVKMVKVQWG